MKRLILLFSVALGLNNNAQTGDKQLDDLLDSARNYIYTDNSKTYFYLTQVEKQATKSNNRIALAYHHQLAGVIDEQLGDYENALKNYTTAVHFSEASGDHVSKLRVLIALSNYYINRSEFKQCIDICHNGIKEALSIKDDELASQFYNNLSLCHSYMNDYDNALIYSDKSIELKKKSNNEESLANAYLNKGLLLTGKQDYTNGFDYYSKAEQIYLKFSNHVALTQTYINFAWDHSDLKSFKQARSYLSKAIYHAEKTNDKIREAGVWNAFGYYYQKAGYKDSVLFALESALKASLTAGDKRNTLSAYRALADHFTNTGKHETALSYYKKAWQLRDTILNEARIKQTQALNARYESRQKEDQIKLLEEQKKSNLLLIEKQRWALLSIVLLALIIPATFSFFFFQYKKQQKLKKDEELRRLKEAERMRISRDMHDEIGAGLTRMVMRSEQMKMKLNSSGAQDVTVRDNLDKISSESRELSKNIGEIIWALNPQNDSLDLLFSYIRNYAYDYLDGAGIACIIDFPDDLPAIAVSSETRRNIFLVVKETLNNIVKHSSATSVEIGMTFSGTDFTLSIKDNGKGISEELSSSGNGLKNMNKRAAELGGRFLLRKAEAGGTIVTLSSVPVKNTTKVG